MALSLVEEIVNTLYAVHAKCPCTLPLGHFPAIVIVPCPYIHMVAKATTSNQPRPQLRALEVWYVQRHSSFHEHNATKRRHRGEDVGDAFRVLSARGKPGSYLASTCAIPASGVALRNITSVGGKHMCAEFAGSSGGGLAENR